MQKYKFFSKSTFLTKTKLYSVSMKKRNKSMLIFNFAERILEMQNIQKRNIGSRQDGIIKAMYPANAIIEQIIFLQKFRYFLKKKEINEILLKKAVIGTFLRYCYAKKNMVFDFEIILIFQKILKYKTIESLYANNFLKLRNKFINDYS